jgi:hypothetical protein
MARFRRLARDCERLALAAADEDGQAGVFCGPGGLARPAGRVRIGWAGPWSMIGEVVGEG